MGSYFHSKKEFKELFFRSKNDPRYREVKVFRYSFSEAIPIFFNRHKSDFFCCPIAMKFSPVIAYGLKNCENVVLSNIDITMTTINKKL